ncbi:beta-1,4-glucuronyltransferase 1-like [Homarus americanus]|uniref:beta-1,4-glucuronyltransferase 1-like n=1 Tax=Homarus americanus TaxID=6706 RepID=UPI001C439F22|nr:beta-1,4-glucuronyltransferase 1-like [Homarus americanus]
MAAPRWLLTRASMFLNVALVICLFVYTSPPTPADVLQVSSPHSLLVSKQYESAITSSGVTKLATKDLTTPGSVPSVGLSLETPLDSLERKMYPELHECSNWPKHPITYNRGDYWILENYILATASFLCNESVTYSTHGDFTYLENLKILAERWKGPISVAVYAPGDDFNSTVNIILYLRECWDQRIKQQVTFHIYFHTSFTPKQVPPSEALLQRVVNCTSDIPRWTNITTFRKTKQLLYPVNVGRNVARQASQTYFVFPSDIELYPSINFIPGETTSDIVIWPSSTVGSPGKIIPDIGCYSASFPNVPNDIPEFIKMLKKPDVSNSTNHRVFVFSIFEVKKDVKPPETKSKLIEMLKGKKAFHFHKNICPKCHAVPKSMEWMNAPIRPGMSVFHIGKRNPPHHNQWEPIYVGTNKEPLYDERLSWEGKSDKMTQMFIMCLKNYEFHILDNAFLVHKPGIKTNTKDVFRNKVTARQNSLLSKEIRPQYKSVFGLSKNCTV